MLEAQGDLLAEVEWAVRVDFFYVREKKDRKEKKERKERRYYDREREGS